MDLFTPVVEDKLLHPNFRRLVDRWSEPDRQVLEEWAEGFVDRDGKFVQEFQTTFNSGFWELYIFACCKELGLKIDFGFRSPDFVINKPLREFSIEAVIASNARGEDAEWERNLKSAPKLPDLEVVLDTAVIRLSNAIHSKHQKFQQYYQALPHVKGRPFVLAVAPFEQPYFWATNDHAIRQVLYGYDRVGPGGEHLFRKNITKHSGAIIELSVFTSPRVSRVSAVLFSNTATMSKVHALNSEVSDLMWFSALRFNRYGPNAFLQNASKLDYRESLLDGLYVFHNPHARYPLAFDVFNHDDITQATLLEGNPVPRYKCKHGHLIQRSSMQLRAKES